MRSLKNLLYTFSYPTYKTLSSRANIKKGKQTTLASYSREMGFLVFLLLSVLNVCGQSEVVPLRVYIDGAEGRDSLGCLNSSSTETPCQSLSLVAETLTQKHSVSIEILGHVLNLTRAVNFTDYSNITVSGSGTNTTLYCNESDAGLAFIRVVNLSIYSLTIDNCGALRPSTSIQNRSLLYLPVAVYVFSCSNVSLNTVDIVSSNGTGLSMYNTNGVVDIMYCNFVNNSVMNMDDFGGGGMHIEFTTSIPRSFTHKDRSSQNHNSKYRIQNCTFKNNSAHSPQTAHKFIPPSQQVFVPRLGKGGGLYISIGSDATNNTFVVKNCALMNNTASYNSGGMIAEFLNSVKHNSVSVIQTYFERNKCVQTQYSSAGGLSVAFMFYSLYAIDKERPYNNSFQCHLCSFKANKGHMGGGTAIFATKETNTLSLSTVEFSNCNWTENESAMGAAVFITPAIWDYTQVGYLPVPMFCDCRFESNSASEKLEAPIAEGHGVNVESVGYGALFVSEFRVLFSRSFHFGSNKGSAIHLSNSVIEFESGSDGMFYNNTSLDGGAIAMYSSSMIKIGNSSTFLFVKNKAHGRGGAIYSFFGGATRPAYHSCFITSKNFSPVNSSFVFRENIANANGNSIFSTTFQSCALLCSVGNVSARPADIMQCIANFTFYDSENTTLSLSTRPEKFTLEVKPPLKLMPGEEYQIPLSAYDEAQISLNHLTYSASVTSADVSIDRAFVQVSNNTVKLLGKNGSVAQLKLFTGDILVSLKITLKDCQPGYHYSPSNRKCECAASEYLGLEGCNPNVYIRQGYWMGYCSGNGSELCTAFCPHGYCSYNKINKGEQLHALPNDSTLLDSDICGPKRTNRLCGECSPGHSVRYNSWKSTCDSENLCHLGWLFFILSVIIPLTLLFILVVLVLNISFTTGNTNCFVLYGQVLGPLAFNGNDSLQLSKTVKLIQQVASFPYNSFNLNFLTFESLSYCLWKGASYMEAMMIKYLTAGFVLALVLFTMFLARYRYIWNKYLFRFQHRNSVLIHGLSAFFILCYSQSVRTTFHILNYSCLYSANIHCAVKVVHQAGHLTYFEGEHIPYAIAAVLVLLFMIVIPPLLLLSYPLMFKLFGLCGLSETRLVTTLWRMMPIQFLDAFQSSFKDKYRFFAGLYFLYRAAIFAFYVCTQSLLEFYSSVQLLLIFIMTLHFVFQPHKERKHNIVDFLLFANLSLINGITLYYYCRTEILGQFKSEVLFSVLAVIQAVLIILPLLLVIALSVIEWGVSRKKRKDYEDLPSLQISRE